MGALFVVGVRFGSIKSFDEKNLYITRRNNETVVPLNTITSIRLASNGGVGSDNFNLFKERVQYYNPSVEIRNWSTSLDGLIRLFRSGRK